MDVVRKLSAIKLSILLVAGVAAAGLGWIIVNRLSYAIAQQERAVDSLGEPARTLLQTPLLAVAPGALAAVLALFGLLVPRLRLVALLLATLALLLAVLAMVATMLQVLGPMYEMQRL